MLLARGEREMASGICHRLDSVLAESDLLLAQD